MHPSRALAEMMMTHSDEGDGTECLPHSCPSDSPFAPSISNCLNFKLPVESSTQPQPLQDVLL